MSLNIVDVRAQMPNYENYEDWDRNADILGIAVHHSATVDRQTGAPSGDAFSYFNYHVNTLGWAHGGYNYVITGDGTIQYALDEKIAAYHAGFRDPDNSEGLEYGQFWNNHYLAICMSGWFSNNRTYRDQTGTHTIPNNHTHPSQAQLDSLLALVRHLRDKYSVVIEHVRGHRELLGNSTQCPGLNLDPADLRARLQEDPEPPPVEPVPQPGEHVVVLPNTGETLDAALTYIWKFQPDVSFAPQTAAGRWLYFTAVGDIGDDLLADYRLRGARIVDHIGGDIAAIGQQLDQLVAENRRFLTPDDTPPPEPEPDYIEYTVQPGDSLSKIALHFYGQASLWTVIFAANRDQISDPGRITPGMVLKIPPKPE